MNFIQKIAIREIQKFIHNFYNQYIKCINDPIRADLIRSLLIDLDKTDKIDNKNIESLEKLKEIWKLNK